jgi:hypothetical protein
MACDGTGHFLVIPWYRSTEYFWMIQLHNALLKIQYNCSSVPVARPLPSKSANIVMAEGKKKSRGPLSKGASD